MPLYPVAPFEARDRAEIAREALQRRAWELKRATYDMVPSPESSNWNPQFSVFPYADFSESERITIQEKIDRLSQPAGEIAPREERLVRERLLELRRILDHSRAADKLAPESPSVSAKLVFTPGAFSYCGHRQPLKGKPLDVLKALDQATAKTLTLKALQDKVWSDSVTGTETVRSAVKAARAALRMAIKATGVKTLRAFDPIPAVERGSDRTAWRLDLP